MQLKPRLPAAALSFSTEGLSEGNALGGFSDATGANARGANADLLANAIEDGPDAAQVRIPAAAAHIVRMANHVPVARFFAADFTCKCHDLLTPHNTGRFIAFDATRLSCKREALCRAWSCSKCVLLGDISIFAAISA